MYKVDHMTKGYLICMSKTQAMFRNFGRIGGLRGLKTNYHQNRRVSILRRRYESSKFRDSNDKEKPVNI